MDEDRKGLRDSGKRQEFVSGAVRDQAIGKGRFDLTCPHADFREARVFEKGSIKYGDRNWEKGMPVMRYLDSARRHIAQLMVGDNVEDHAAQARWNLSAYMETLYRIETGELPPELDNRPARMKPNFVPPYKEHPPGVAEVMALAEAITKK